MRRGKIIAEATGWYRVPGSKITITPVGYYVNDYGVEGLKTLINNGRNDDGYLEYLISVTDAMITQPDGGQLSWESERKRVWIEGENTPWPMLADDVYLISGQANGTTVDGLDYVITITSDLRVELGCKWVVSGTLEVVPGDLSPRVLDYGQGDCDNEATVYVNGITFNIILP